MSLQHPEGKACGGLRVPTLATGQPTDRCSILERDARAFFERWQGSGMSRRRSRARPRRSIPFVHIRCAIIAALSRIQRAVALALRTPVEGLFLPTRILVGRNGTEAPADRSADLDLPINIPHRHEAERRQFGSRLSPYG